MRFFSFDRHHILHMARILLPCMILLFACHLCLPISQAQAQSGTYSSNDVTVLAKMIH